NSTEQNSAPDGSFSVAPEPDGLVRVPAGPDTTTEDVAEPTCIFIVYEDGAVAEVQSYPLGSLDACSVEALVSARPDEAAKLCPGMKG
ncbi:MAG: hypothetical protein EBZ48_14650, partial [Proteobacteria bacterium]|nr:hypothetical protein [Pseudomonadota bacterium]